jgi:hypothetical protein
MNMAENVFVKELCGSKQYLVFCKWELITAIILKIFGYLYLMLKLLTSVSM